MLKSSPAIKSVWTANSTTGTGFNLPNSFPVGLAMMGEVSH